CKQEHPEFSTVPQNVLTMTKRGEEPPVGTTERRRSSRFPIEREVRYKTLNQRVETQTGIGKTLNISSSGVLFTTEHDLPVGTRLEVSISWPAQLNDRCMLNLVARGRVTRNNKGQLALQIQQYEFRTQSRLGGPKEK
ncbi:MAG: PilZ domain-containing protein, partial [Bryobacteraceae bacterium]